MRISKLKEKWIAAGLLFATSILIWIVRASSTDSNFEPRRWEDKYSRKYMWLDLQSKLRSQRPSGVETFEMLGPPAGFEGSNAKEFIAWLNTTHISQVRYQMPSSRYDWFAGPPADYLVVFLDQEKRAVNADLENGD